VDIGVVGVVIIGVGTREDDVAFGITVQLGCVYSGMGVCSDRIEIAVGVADIIVGICVCVEVGNIVLVTAKDDVLV
jgi:hypothetical protein